MCHILSRTLTSRARLEEDLDTKRGLLVKAGDYRERNIELMDRFLVIWFGVHGVNYYLLAEIKEELALIEPDPIKKLKLFEDAKSRKENSLALHALEPPGPGTLATHGYQDGYGTTLLHLYEQTKNREHLINAIKAWQNAIEIALEAQLFGRTAESFWKIAKTHDIMNEYLEAAENFNKASESYLKAAENIPQLKDFYQEYSTYMQAWCEIENARHHHVEKRYGEAKEYYEKAAELHKSTERWSLLAPNYLAWARLEEAEDLSRREQTEEARDLFQKAVELFSETEDSIKSKLNTIEVEEELIKVSDVRREYCLGRVALEGARILDRQGDHSTSSRRYSQAVERFQKVMSSLKSESDKKELLPIISLCKAWEKMMMAETQMSSSLFNEAAELFLEARENASDQTTRLLAQAHSSFCRALEAGTEFEVTRDTDLFSEAKRHIEAATSHYLRAGHRSSSDYATATNRLLDGYMYAYNGQTEMDPSRKARFYQMAERLLQDSAGLFLKAKHPEKSDEVRTILENIKGEKEIALSLAEMMHASAIVSTTSSFSIPTPSHEQAVGLDRFETADIQANFIARRRELGVGEDLALEIELVNAGKAPAQLVKVEDIIIPGFELKSYPVICRVEDSYLDMKGRMKGRTLSPLKTQELKLVLKPLKKGSFELKPRILYLDESGKYKSHVLEPVSINVQELGIKGWLRGPTR
jgi:tetratricopeptide (TPR) repeat protein